MGAISQGLKELAENLKKGSDKALASAEDDEILFEAVAHTVANAVVNLTKLAEMVEEDEPQFTTEQLRDMINLANALDAEGEPRLQKQASVLDEILLTIAAPKSAVAQAAARTEEEINRLREKYRAERRDQLYHEKTTDEFDRQRRREAIQSAIKDQVKEFKPLEHTLSTRYCPDHPGAGLVRIADRVYQCSLDHKVYNFESGYTTMKGNKIPGGGVDMQSPDWGHRDQGHAIFDTRESLMSRFAEKENDITKKAQDFPQEGTDMPVLESPENHDPNAHQEGEPAPDGGSWHWDQNRGYWTIVHPGMHPGEEPLLAGASDDLKKKV